MAKKTKTSKGTNSDFIIIHRVVIRDHRLSDGAFRLYCYLLDLKNDKVGGIVWVNQSTMAQDLHLSIPSITKRIDELTSAGLIVQEKLKFWPESGDPVIGRNKLKYQILPATQAYPEKELRKNWNSIRKEATSSNPMETEGLKLMKISASNTKKPSGSIEQDLLDQYLEEQNLEEHSLERDLYNQGIFVEEGVKIGKDGSEVLIHYKKSLEKYGRTDLPFEYSRRDISKIKYAVNRYSGKEVLQIIDYALKNWSDLQMRYPKLEGTFFSLNTLHSDWLDIIEACRNEDEKMAILDEYYGYRPEKEAENKNC